MLVRYRAWLGGGWVVGLWCCETVGTLLHPCRTGLASCGHVLRWVVLSLRWFSRHD